MIIIDIIGYIGMGLVILSFLFKDIRYIRITNICGSILSAIYGFLTVTYPTMILNLILIIVNVIMLIRRKNGR